MVNKARRIARAANLEARLDIIIAERPNSQISIRAVTHASVAYSHPYSDSRCLLWQRGGGRVLSFMHHEPTKIQPDKNSVYVVTILVSPSHSHHGSCLIQILRLALLFFLNLL